MESDQHIGKVVGVIAVVLVLRSAALAEIGSGAYVNFLTQDETDRTALAYGATYDRLVQLKKKYDPTNLFRMNQNIKPV